MSEDTPQLYYHLHECLQVFAPLSATAETLADFPGYNEAILKLCGHPFEVRHNSIQISVINEPNRDKLSYRFCFQWGFGPLPEDQQVNFPDGCENFLVLRKNHTPIYDDPAEVYRSLRAMLAGQTNEFSMAFLKYIRPESDESHHLSEREHHLQTILDDHFNF
jgi:hypothetical protein